MLQICIGILLKFFSALLLFNFLALWLSCAHLMKLILPVASFCGALYQIHAINNLMEQSYSHSDVFAVSGNKPLHISKCIIREKIAVRLGDYTR